MQCDGLLDCWDVCYPGLRKPIAKTFLRAVKFPTPSLLAFTLFHLFFVLAKVLLDVLERMTFMIVLFTQWL
jgi:hypothetical protein